MTSILEQHQFCPHSGQPITTKPAWQNIQIGSDYTMSFGIIGENILLTIPKGNIRTVQFDLAIEARKNVLRDHFGTSDPVIVEIRDFRDIHGIPSHETRTLFRKSFTRHCNQKGLFVLNASWIIQAVFVAGLRLQEPPFPVTLNHSYATAIAGAIDLFNEKAQSPQTKWHTQTSSVQVTHEIRAHSIIFTQANGQLTQGDIPSILGEYEKLLQSPELAPGAIFRIADYTNATKSDWKGRLLLIQGLNKLHTTYNHTPLAMAIYGLNKNLRTAMKLAGKILDYPIFFATDKTEAFAYIHKLQQHHSTEQFPTEEHSAEVEDILRFIATIIWDDSMDIDQEQEDIHNQPLTPISEALLVVKQDVSQLLQEAKDQTEEIATKNSQLKAEIKRRKVIEGRLIATMKQVEAANQAKGAFLATMSHEIRTPMNGILGMLHLLKNTDLSEEQRKYINISSNSAASLLKLINNILDFSKVDQSQLQMEKIPFDLNELCTSCCHLFYTDLQEKPIELQCRIDPNLTQYIIGDPGKLRQIIINLLSNAIKFTPSGIITLQATIQTQTPEHISIQFTVRDTGIGIAPDKINSIFNTFSQAEPSTTRQYGGTGLGLSISRKICQFMDGDLQATSTINEGTTFSFTLPFGLGEPLLKPAPVPKTEQRLRPSQQDTDILIVEDEPINQLFIETLLDQFGYQHDHAKNGLQAIEALEKKHYPILLMDCQMPVMDGYEATARIRTMSFDKEAPIIIALTAHAMEGDRKHCLECGMDEYISKPIEPAILLKTLEKYQPTRSSHHEPT